MTKPTVVRGIKMSFTFPPWKGREGSLFVEDVEGLEISSLHIVQPSLDWVDPFQMLDGEAQNYPYLKVVCISEAVESLDAGLWMKKSTYLPML